MRQVQGSGTPRPPTSTPALADATPTTPVSLCTGSATTSARQAKDLLGRGQSEGYVYDHRDKRVVDDGIVIVVPVLSYKIEF